MSCHDHSPARRPLVNGNLGAIVATGLIAVLIAGQLLAMLRFLTNPRQLAPWYNGVGVTQYVAGMMVSALAMGGNFG